MRAHIGWVSTVAEFFRERDMISADLSLPEWNWLGPWFAAAHARFANDQVERHHVAR
jgi:hypothetical protein